MQMYLLINLNDTAREYTSMQGIKIVDKDGKEITKVIFDIKNGKIIIE